MKKSTLFLVIVAIATFSFQLSTFNSFAQTQKQIWGMTYGGGMDSAGVIFRTDGSGNNCGLQQTFFENDNDGSNPSGSLALAPDGKLYGMTHYGGANNLGVLFQYNPATYTYTKKFDFDGASNGSYPGGSLMLASNGKFYGMTFAGGANGVGVLFQFDPTTNTYTKNIDLSAANGDNPYGSLMQASDGKFYGMTYGGGANGVGVLFQYDPANNTYTKKINLSLANGSYPYGSLIQASDGNLYGMTSQGGANNVGVIFQYDPALNIYSKMIDLTTANGANPQGSLMQASNGKLYGMTFDGGLNNAGVLFDYIPSTNSYTNKFDFDGTANGSQPMGSLMQASNGKIYGMTTFGGTTGAGVLFQYDPATSNYTKKVDFHGTNGASPHYTSLIELSISLATSSITTVNCAGDSISVPYSLSGAFDTGNIFTAQLSDASGNFSGAVTLDSINSTVNGSIRCMLPPNTTTGTGYRMRIISSRPAIAGSDNGSNITINALPIVSANTTANTVCSGNTVTLTGGGATSYVWTGGITNGLSFIPLSTKTYTVTGTDSHNCSATATKTITVLLTSSSNQSRTFCQGQSLTVGTHTYTSSSTYHDTLTSVNGCDSMVTTHLTVLTLSAFNQTFTKCAGQSVTVGTHTYTTSAIYHDTLTSLVNGCDSVVTTQLTIIPASAFFQSIAVCSGSSISVGSHQYSANGTYHDTLTSFGYGCDSIVTTHLSVNLVDTSVSVSTVTLTANAPGATYKWIDCNNGNITIAGQTNQSYTATANGNYAVIVTQNNCSDTSSCYNITGIGISQLSMNNYQLSIFPNPFNLQTTISFTRDQKNSVLKIRDVLGKEIKTINFSGKKLLLEKGEMKEGIYFLQVINENKNVGYRKIIVQ